MKELREYRETIKNDSLDALAAAVASLIEGGAPPISDVHIEALSLRGFRTLVARYEPKPCYVRDCSNPVIRNDEDCLVCAEHSAADVMAQEEADEDEATLQEDLSELVADGLLEIVDA